MIAQDGPQIIVHFRVIPKNIYGNVGYASVSYVQWIHGTDPHDGAATHASLMQVGELIQTCINAAACDVELDI